MLDDGRVRDALERAAQLRRDSPGAAWSGRRRAPRRSRSAPRAPTAARRSRCGDPPVDAGHHDRQRHLAEGVDTGRCGGDQVVVGAGDLAGVRVEQDLGRVPRRHPESVDLAGADVRARRCARCRRCVRPSAARRSVAVGVDQAELHIGDPGHAVGDHREVGAALIRSRAQRVRQARDRATSRPGARPAGRPGRAGPDASPLAFFFAGLVVCRRRRRRRRRHCVDRGSVRSTRIRRRRRRGPPQRSCGRRMSGLRLGIWSILPDAATLPTKPRVCKRIVSVEGAETRPTGCSATMSRVTSSPTAPSVPRQAPSILPGPDSVLHLTEVTVRRGPSVLLDAVNWNVDVDERWVILGPNGAGKTTLLQIASRPDVPHVRPGAHPGRAARRGRRHRDPDPDRPVLGGAGRPGAADGDRHRRGRLRRLRRRRPLAGALRRARFRPGPGTVGRHGHLRRWRTGSTARCPRGSANGRWPRGR